MKCILNRHQFISKYFGNNLRKIKITSLKCSKNSTKTEVILLILYYIKKFQKVDAGDIAVKYYTAFNDRDIDLCMSYFSEDVIYEDLVYPNAFKGTENLKFYFKEIMSDVDPGLKFCIDDYSSGENCSKSGILWSFFHLINLSLSNLIIIYRHVEIDGIEMPFSRGCSFVRVNDQNKITFARDLVEPFFKTEDATSKVNIINFK